MNQDHTFDEAELIGGMREALAHAKGKLMLKTAKVSRSSRKMTPAQIAQIRRLRPARRYLRHIST